MASEWQTVCHSRDAHPGFLGDCNGTHLVPAPWFGLPFKGLLMTLEWQRSCHSRVFWRPLNGRICECKIMLWLSMWWYDMTWYVMIWYDMIPEYLKINENQWNKLCYAMLCYDAMTWWYDMIVWYDMTWWYDMKMIALHDKLCYAML